MTPLQKATLRASEIRTKLAALGGADELTEEQTTEIGELRAEYQDVETRVQALTVAADEPEVRETTEDGEARERRELRSRISIGDYAVAAVEKRAVQGPAAEYNAALKIGAHRFPLEVLAPALEERATTGVDIAVRPSRWLDRLFNEAAALAVGVTFESVEPGVASFPVTTAGATGKQRAKAQAADDAAWTIGVTELKPTRNAVRAVATTEDMLRNPGLQDGLTRDLRMALMDAIDAAVFKGDAGGTGTDADITGLETAADVTEQEITQANKVKGVNTLEAFAELIDGKHAARPSDLKAVLSVGANTLWSHTLANSGASVDTTIAEFLRRFGLDWMTRGGIDAATTNGKFGAFVGLGRGIEGAGVAAVWSDGMLITDPYTGAAKGEIALTMNYQWAFGLPRATNFARIKFVT